MKTVLIFIHPGAEEEENEVRQTNTQEESRKEEEIREESHSQVTEEDTDEEGHTQESHAQKVHTQEGSNTDHAQIGTKDQSKKTMWVKDWIGNGGAFSPQWCFKGAVSSESTGHGIGVLVLDFSDWK